MYAEALSIDCEKCGCVRPEGAEDEGCEGATPGSCRDAGISGFGWESPSGVSCSFAVERLIDVEFLDYREVRPTCPFCLLGS